MRTPDAPMGWPMRNLRAEKRFAQRIATGALAAEIPTIRVDFERLAEDTQSAGRTLPGGSPGGHVAATPARRRG